MQLSVLEVATSHVNTVWYYIGTLGAKASYIVEYLGPLRQNIRPNGDMFLYVLGGIYKVFPMYDHGQIIGTNVPNEPLNFKR